MSRIVVGDGQLSVHGKRHTVELHPVGNLAEVRRLAVHPDRLAPRPKRPDQVVGGPETKNTLATLKAFVNSASTHSEPVCTVEHGRAAVLTCLVVRASVDAGAAVMTDQVA